MALSSHADSGQQRAEHDNIGQYLTDNNTSKNSTGFIPNPAAKPFFPAETNFYPPNGMKLKWKKHTNAALSASHQRKPFEANVNGTEEPTNGFHLRFLQHGATSPLLSHSSPNAEEEVPPLMIPPCDNEHTAEDDQSKKHIAFHLLSTVLDDEILEDQGQFPLTTNAEEQQNGNPSYERSESWPVNSASLSSSFSLSLDLHDSNAAPPAGFDNRIIHEIWSPKPSPRDSYPSTPSEEGMPYLHNNSDPFDTSMNKSDNEQRISPAENSHIIGSAPTSMPNHVTESPPYGSGFDDYYCKDRARSLPHSSRSTHEQFKQNRSHNNQPNVHQNRYMKRINSVNGYVNDNRDYRKAYIYNGMNQPVIDNSRPMNGINKHHNGNGKEYGEVFRVHAAEKLGCCLDDCLDQLRNLERECRKAEQELSKVYPPRRPSSSGSSHMPRLPPNPTRVDRMIVDQTKEHNKVESLIGRIERLSRSPMHSNVGVALDQWLACIKDLQMTRKDEIANSHNSSGYGSKSYAVKDLLALSHVVQDLIGHTRSARTIVWCAMQMLHVDDDWLHQTDSCSNLERSMEKS